MRKQVGWVNQRTGHFIGLSVKAGPHGDRFKGYETPAFIDDETESPTLLQSQVWNRILVNQQKMMRELACFATTQKRASELLEAIVDTASVIDDIKKP